MSRCYVIAEAGLNHNGSMELARQMIDLAADAGADCVKFQKRNVDTLAVGSVLDADDPRFPSLGRTYRQIRQSLEFTLDQFRELKARAESRGLQFMVTPFDIPSLEFLQQLGVNAFKLASHSVTNLPLLERVARTGKRTFLSTGMCTLEELDEAVAVFKAQGTDLTILHCVSAYPTPLEDCNLRLIDVLRQRYGCPVGYSGHELGWLPTTAAVARGAAAVERHFTMDKQLEGFDHKMSLDPTDLKAMLRDIRLVEATLGTGEKRVSDREMITRRKYHVSMVTARPIPAGAVVTHEMITWKNPGTGIPPREAAKIIGKRARREIPPDILVEPGMVE